MRCKGLVHVCQTEEGEETESKRGGPEWVMEGKKKRERWGVGGRKHLVYSIYMYLL